MARFTWDAMYEQLTPVYGGVPLWQSTQDMLDAFWLSRGYADAPQGDALYAFYVAQGAVGVTLPDLENDYWDRIGPNVLVGLGAVLVLDARHSVPGEQWALNMGSGGNVLRAKYGSVARHEVRNNVGLVLSAGGINYASTPNTAALSIAGDIQLVARYGGIDWAAGAFNTHLVGKYTASGVTRDWSLAIQGNRLAIWAFDGTTTQFYSCLVVFPGSFDPAKFYWFMATLDVDDGAGNSVMRYYWAEDSEAIPTSWTNFGGDRTVAAFTHPNTSTVVSFGGSSVGTVNSDGVLKRAIVYDGIDGTTVLDVDFTKQADLTTSFVCDTGQTVTVTAANAVDTNDPLFLPWNGENYLYAPPVANNSASTPNVPGTQIGDIMEHRMDLWFDPSIMGPLTGKLASPSTPSSYSWYIQKHSGGRLSFAVSDGTNDVAPLTGDVTSILTTGRYRFKFRYERDTGSGQYSVSFAYSSDITTPIEDIVSWTLLGPALTGASIGATVDTAYNIFTGTYRNSTGAFDGKYYRHWFSVNDTVVYDVDFTKNTSQTSFVCTTGQTVTINRATSGRKSVVVTRPCWLFGTDDYMEVADNALLDIGSGETVSVVALVRSFAPVAGMPIIGKASSISASLLEKRWLMRYTSSSGVFRILDDGVVFDNVGVSTTSGNLSMVAFTINASEVSTYSGNTLSGPSARGTDDMGNALVLRIGGISTSFLDGEIYAVAVFRRALTPAEIAQVVAAFGAS